MYVWPVCDASQLDTVDVDGVLAVLSAASECDAQIRPRETLYLHQQRPRRILYRLCQKQVINIYNNGPVAFCTASVNNKLLSHTMMQHMCSSQRGIDDEFHSDNQEMSKKIKHIFQIWSSNLYILSLS